jgi:hypothetical protein
MRPLLLAMLCLAATRAQAQPSAAPLPPAPEFVSPPPLVPADEPPSPPSSSNTPVEPPTAPPALPPVSPQQPTAPPEVPSASRQEPPEATPLPPPPLPGYTGPALPPAERAQRYVDPGRYRSYSAGPGGLTLIITELISGAVGGGLVGAARDRGGGIASGLVTGGLALGAASAFYQYLARVEQNEGWLVAIAATAGFTTGFGVASERGSSRMDRALLSVAGTQAAVVTTLAMTSLQPGDVSAGDTWLMGTSSLYALIFTALVQGSMDTPGKDTDFTPTLLAPSLGLIAGALLAFPLEPHPGSMFAITVLPIAAGLAVARLAETAREPTLSRILLVTMGSTFLITIAVATLSQDAAPEELTRGSGLQALPVPVVMEAGRGQDSLAVGPGLLMRF